MRLELKGSAPPVESIVIQLTAGSFDKTPWVSLGYTNYTVVCIGAAGGLGGNAGGYANPQSDSAIRYGGGGGGGGLAISSGLLSSLGTLSTVAIGAAGANGGHVSLNGTTAPNGADGGATTFAATVCQASGGKGGKGASLANDWSVSPGGAGGIGGSSVAGGGGAGGYASSAGIFTQAMPGTFDGAIGAGGGGGYGQITVDNQGYYPGILAGAGSVAVPGVASTSQSVAAGRVPFGALAPAHPNSNESPNGGGANAMVVTGAHYIAGTQHHALWSVPGSKNGVCFIKLTV